MISAILITFVALLNLGLGMAVLLRNTRNTSHKLFFIATCCCAVWGAANFVANSSDSHATALFMVHLSYFAAYNIMLTLVFFMLFFTGILKRSLLRVQAVGGVLFIFSLTAFSDLVVKDVNLVPGKIVDEQAGMLLLPYLAATAILCVTVIIIVAYSFNASRQIVTPRVKAQLQLITLGIFISFVIGFLLNGLYPLLTKDYSTTNIGPLSTIFLIIFTAVAMIRHRLFDIRPVIARSIAYLLSLFVLASVYATLAFGFAAQVFDTGRISLLQELIYIGLALSVALTFSHLKHFFDNVTKHIFFHDAYETQEVLDRLSQLLVGGADVEQVINGAARIISTTLKPDFTYVAVLNDQKNEALVTVNLGDTSPGINGILGGLSSSPKKIWISDELRDDEREESLARTLRSLNIALVVRLQTETTVGYILLGYKQSGNTYSVQDINMLSIASDELAIAVQNGLRFMEISSFNITLRQKVEDATDELRRTNEQLKSLDEAKDEFISMASHQLRTPLTSVKGYLSMALEGDAGELTAAQRKLLEEAYASSQRMVYLIGDFLNVSRINTGKFTLELSDLNLAKLVQEEVNQLSTTAQSRNLVLQYQQPEDFPTIKLDDNKIRQVVMNFIDNAIFYSKSGSDVKIELTRGANQIIFKVKDSGIGVPADERQHLFTKFYRATNARKARPDGTGIGLFMAKKVMVAHGGSIIFDSTEGQGSVFGFSLPLPAASDAASTSSQDAPELQNNPNNLDNHPDQKQQNSSNNT